MSFKRAELRRLAGMALLSASVSLAAALSAETQPATTTAKAPAHHTVHHRRSHKARVRGQKAIDGDRVLQIQQALVREHYLKGEPSGKWDSSTQQALQRYQADQGWQSKAVPDSRALIRLGLGPDNQHLLNPESAMTTAPGKQSSESAKAASSDAASAATAGSSQAGESMPAAQVASPSSGIASPVR
jgi:Putative peptidoglycan binding domain